MATRNPQLTAWHSSTEFRDLARAFHDENARIPESETLEQAKKHFGQLSVRILEVMRAQRIALRMENQGSSYEGIKTRSSSLEFDCMVVLCGGDTLTMDSSGCPSGFTRLRVNKPGQAPEWLNRLQMGSSSLDPEKGVSWFQGQLQKAIDQLSCSVKLRRHGDTAVQMDVKHSGSLWYSVDMVPGFEVNERSFVAKSSKKAALTWRQSFAQKEKALMKNIDRNNQCHKMVARMIKVIREIDDPMKPLQSYTVKTALLNLSRDHPEWSWSQDDLGKRFVDVLAYLRDCMTSGMLPHYYIRNDLNVLEGYHSNPVHLTNMRNRLDRWLNSDVAMKQLLTRNVRDVTYRAAPASASRAPLSEVFPEDA